MQNYKIDLLDGTLDAMPAKKFIYLINGLTKNSAIGQRIESQIMEKQQKKAKKGRTGKNTVSSDFRSASPNALITMFKNSEKSR